MSWIFTCIIWFLCGISFLVENGTAKIIIAIIQIVLLIAQYIYIYFESKK